MIHDISDKTYHEILVNLPLLLHGVLCNSLLNSQLAGLYNAYRSMIHDISDKTYHDILVNLPLLLHNIAQAC